MVTTKRRSPTSTLVSKGAISSAATILEGLAEKPKEIWSLREAIDLLKEPISAALDRGYSYAEVSKMLTEKGVEISPSTLKYYLSSARKEKDGSKPKTRRRKTQGITLNPETVTLTNGNGNGAAAKPEPVAETTTAKRPRATTVESAKSAAKTTAKSAPTAKAKPAATKAKATATKAAPKTPSTRGRKKAAG